MSHVSNNVHRLVVVKHAHRMFTIEAVSIIWTWWHLQNWWRIAKLKLSNELEWGAFIYGMTYDTYIDINIAWGAVWPVWSLFRLAPTIFMPWWAEPQRHTVVILFVCLSVCVCVCVLFCSTFFSVTAMNSLSNESCNAITTQHSNAAKMSRFSLLGFAVNDSLW